MKQEDYDFFKANGYLSLGKILSDDEVARFVDAFDRDRRDFGRFWKENDIWQTRNGHALLTAPEFDEIIRHPEATEPLQVLMGGEVCFSEISLRHMGPYEGEPIPGLTSWEGPIGRRWHRDGGDRLMWPEHPLRIGYLQLMVYLSDVSDQPIASPSRPHRPIVKSWIGKLSWHGAESENCTAAPVQRYCSI